MASVLNEKYFTDEAAAFTALEAIVWPNGPTCPHCGATDRINRLVGVRSKPSQKNPEGVERHGLWKCYHCRGQFTVRKGTVFEASHLPLHQWFQAAFLMCSSKKGVSSNQLHRTLGCTLKTAWFVPPIACVKRCARATLPCRSERAAVRLRRRKPSLDANRASRRSAPITTR